MSNLKNSNDGVETKNQTNYCALSNNLNLLSDKYLVSVLWWFINQSGLKKNTNCITARYQKIQKGTKLAISTIEIRVKLLQKLGLLQWPYEHRHSNQYILNTDLLNSIINEVNEINEKNEDDTNEKRAECIEDKFTPKPDIIGAAKKLKKGKLKKADPKPSKSIYDTLKEHYEADLLSGKYVEPDEDTSDYDNSQNLLPFEGIEPTHGVVETENIIINNTNNEMNEVEKTYVPENLNKFAIPDEYIDPLIVQVKNYYQLNDCVLDYTQYDYTDPTHKKYIDLKEWVKRYENRFDGDNVRYDGYRAECIKNNLPFCSAPESYHIWSKRYTLRTPTYTNNKK